MKIEPRWLLLVFLSLVKGNKPSVVFGKHVCPQGQITKVPHVGRALAVKLANFLMVD
jgi:hypothetical protein